MSGGFGGGLAAGLTNAIQLSQQNKYYDGLSKYREDIAAARQEEAAAKGAGGTGTKSTKGDGMDAFYEALRPMFQPANAQPASTQPPVMINPDFQPLPGYANGGLIMLAKNRLLKGKTSAGGLSMSLKKGGTR